MSEPTDEQKAVARKWARRLTLPVSGEHKPLAAVLTLQSYVGLVDSLAALLAEREAKVRADTLAEVARVADEVQGECINAEDVGWACQEVRRRLGLEVRP